MGKTIQRLRVSIAQHLLQSINRHSPITYKHLEAQETTISDHLLTTVTCRTKYSAEVCTVLHRARIKHQLNIL